MKKAPTRLMPGKTAKGPKRTKKEIKATNKKFTGSIIAGKKRIKVNTPKKAAEAINKKSMTESVIGSKDKRLKTVFPMKKASGIKITKKQATKLPANLVKAIKAKEASGMKMKKAAMKLKKESAMMLKKSVMEMKKASAMKLKMKKKK